MEKWSKEIHLWKVSILITNHLRLGFSIKKSPLHGWFHINLLTCQIQFYKWIN